MTQGTGVFGLGLKALLRLAHDGDALAYIKAKLTAQLFKPGDEQLVFAYVQQHLQKHRVLPKPETLVQQFPIMSEQGALEPPSYYLDLLLNRFEYETINQINLETQQLLLADRTKTVEAMQLMINGQRRIIEQRYRNQIMDVGAEGEKFLMNNYFGMSKKDLPTLQFGWPYLDDMLGTLLPGDLGSVVGRPGMGKTWLMLWIALFNWRVLKRNVMFVSMEMNTLAIVQRIGAMYAGAPIRQLKHGKFASPTLKAFRESISAFETEEGRLYVLNGNLMAEVDPVFELAVQLGVDLITFDGGYLMKHPNRRLDRYTRVAENVELMKTRAEQTEKVALASWQFAKTASKKNKAKGEKETMDDIGYSDAISQTSSVILGLMQEDGIETMNRRKISLLKGRGGETGEFYINWNFNAMDFKQVDDTPQQLEFV